MGGKGQGQALKALVSTVRTNLPFHIIAITITITNMIVFNLHATSPPIFNELFLKLYHNVKNSISKSNS